MRRSFAIDPLPERLGIDGRLYFNDSSDAAEMKEALISVKGGGVGVANARDLRGTVEREAVSVLLGMEPPTKPMSSEAADYYTSPRRHPAPEAANPDGRAVIEWPKARPPGVARRADT